MECGEDVVDGVVEKSVCQGHSSPGAYVGVKGGVCKWYCEVSVVVYFSEECVGGEWKVVKDGVFDVVDGDND